MNMSTYPGMTLGGEVRESVSLDEDDLSDVEDEVFIRDGKNGYKLADDINVKRPLMAPRRKQAKPDLTSRMTNKPPCRAFCKPCCYVFAALSVLIGLIILVVILVSIFPLPLDKLRDWINAKSRREQPKLETCSDFKVKEVWTVNLPKLTSDSPVRLLDLNSDGIQDFIFGFGTGDNILPQDMFCSLIGVPPPCQGGVVALNGLNGEILWRHWLNDTVFNIQCTADVNGDNLPDCLVVGHLGTILLLNSKNSSTIWQLNTGKKNIFVANVIPDQNGDNISDILTSHSSLEKDKVGHIILLSGKTGAELKRVKTPNGAKIFYMPQLVTIRNITYVLFGTGTPQEAGSLNIAPLSSLFNVNKSVESLYQDSKGVLSQSVLVDITGDKILDIITVMYNSTIIAFDGNNFNQVWNYSVPNSLSNISPTPGYFNYDNVTDFLVTFQTHDNILNYNYTKTFVIDGKTGKSFYEPFSSTIMTQLSGLTLSMESFGYDGFLFWTSECSSADKPGTNPIPEQCFKMNSSAEFKLYLLNQFHQPPGYLIYTLKNDLNDSNSVPIMKEIRKYLIKHPKKLGQSEVNQNYQVDPRPIGIEKYGTYRHKEDRNPFPKEYVDADPDIPDQEDYSWQQNVYPGEEPDFSNYKYMEEDERIPYNEKAQLFGDLRKSNNRDPRSKENETHVPRNGPNRQTSKKKNLSELEQAVYGYKNVKSSRNRLFDDTNNSPSEILKDNFFKKEEQRLRKSRFEQRDISSHLDKQKEEETVNKILQEEKKLLENGTLNLWDLESEKEVQDKEAFRGKRSVKQSNIITRITSVGGVVEPLNGTNTTNAIDVVLVTYWLPKYKSINDILNEDLQDCIEDKIKNAVEDDHAYQKTTEIEQRALFQNECLAEQENMKRELPFFSTLADLRLGQMSVRRIRIECTCEGLRNGEKCTEFLPGKAQSWPMFLGQNSDGLYQTRY